MESIYNRDRLYLLDDSTARELNTYKYYEGLNIPHESLSEDGVDIPSDKSKIAGRLSLFNYTQMVMDNNNVMLSLNAPLIDEPEIKKKLREQHDCSIRALVNASKWGTLGRATYDYSNFMYCKELGKVSNNYLVTLRRFESPVGDHINHNYPYFDEGSETSLSQNNEKKYNSQKAPADVGRMVTWLGVSGNKLDEILSYSMHMAWNKDTASWEEPMGADETAGSGNIGNFLNMFDKGSQDRMKRGYQSGIAGSMADYTVGAAAGALPGPVGGALGKVFAAGGTRAYDPKDFAPWQEKHKPYGPVNVINSTYLLEAGDKGGLTFNHTIKLNFDYELRSYDGINPRAAMLDLLGNILKVTHTVGDFWGGGYRNAGGHASNVFTNLPIFKSAAQKGPDAFIDGLVSSFGSILSTITGGAGFSWDGLKNFGGTMLGGLMSGLVNKMGRPQKRFVSSLLKPDPTGLWHLMIGNPKHPILSMGNMIITDVSIKHTGMLGLDDFPTGLRVTVTLEHGKPRSNREIEMMYTNGDARIYYPLSTQYTQIYKGAKTYKSTNVSEKTTLKDEQDGAEAQDYKSFTEQDFAWGHFITNTGLHPNDTEMLKHFLYKDPAEAKAEADEDKKTRDAQHKAAQEKNNRRSNTSAAARR